MKPALAAALLIAACGDDLAPRTPATLTSGAATLDLAADGQALVLARAGQPRLVFGPGAFQVGTVDDLDLGDSFDPYWLLVDHPPPAPAGLAWHAGRRLALVAATDDALELELATDGATVRVALTPEGLGGFAGRVTATSGAPVAYMRLAFDADAREGFYGLGEWGAAVDHRGALRPMQLELDPASESSNDENHAPVPLVIGTTGWGLFVESRRPGVFDVARASPTRLDVIFGTGADSAAGLAFHLLTAEAPLDVLGRYFDVAGYPGLPAPWALGPLLWRDESADQAQVLDDIAQLRARHLATTGIWFDRPYATGVETFDWDPARFPAPRAMLRAVRDAGLRYGVWHAPYLAPATGGDPAPAELAYATSHGFFPPVTGLLVNPWGKPLDLTNPEAVAWWQGRLRAYAAPLGEGDGVEGFKLDYAEDVVVGAQGQRAPWRFADGSDERTMHRDYQLRYHATYRALLPAEGGLLLTRTGRWGDQVHGMIVWPGDLDASFARAGDPLPGTSQRAVGGLPAALIKGLGLSASGFPFSAADTGGYRHAPPGKEVWMRWVEASAAWPAMEVGDSSSQLPWEFTADNGRDAQALEAYRRYALLHLRLAPYVWTHARQIAATGRPIARPVGLAHPALGEHPTDEFLLGDAVLAAPVVEAGRTTRSVLLPPGAWLGWWDGVEHQGRFEAAADLDTLPLFLARGGIVPMLRPSIEAVAPVATGAPIDSYATDPGLLWVRVAPGPTPTSFTVHDGTVLRQAPGELGYVPGDVFTRGAVFEVIATAAPAEVATADGPLPRLADPDALAGAAAGWAWAPATGGTLWIKVPGAAALRVR